VLAVADALTEVLGSGRELLQQVIVSLKSSLV